MKHPCLQKTPSHGGPASIQGGEETSIVFASQGSGQLKVAQGGLVEQKMTLLFHHLDVLQWHIRLTVYRCKVIGRQTGGGNGQRCVIEVQMAQIRHVQHGSQPLIPLCRAEVMLADHGGIEQREEPGELVVSSIFGCQHKFTRLPSKQVVLQAQEAIDPAVR